MQLCMNYYLLLFISLSVINFGIKVKNCVQMKESDYKYLRRKWKS